ncbi:GTPase IMAP family member 9-like [Physella acuta]|uniref:GTPase IMAP family member 9-like n=1 Tax=Physella acuta TaxID=109671 RepID=UPI0027DBA1A5|nr:GTPase IMAP family member 9-like [Physella acuta]
MARASINSTTDLDIILIGKSGNGKSSTGNSILRRENIFEPSFNMDSVTKIPQFEWSEFEGRILQVIDSPGVLDTCEDEEGGITLVHNALQNAMLANPKGYHAFLVVLKFGNRFTIGEQQTVQILKGILGENFLKDYGIIVMANGETFEQNCRKDKTLSLKTFCADQRGPFKSILEECNNRIVVFSNLTQDENVKNRQVQQLIAMVDELENDGRRYTNEHFKRADKFYQHLLVSTSIPMLTKQTLKEQSLIMQAIKAIETLPEQSEKIDSLENILPRLEKLINSLKEKDRETGKLVDFITNANDTKDLVNALLQLYKSKSSKQATPEVLNSLNHQAIEIECTRQNLHQKMKKSFFEKFRDILKRFGPFIFGSAEILANVLLALFS